MTFIINTFIGLYTIFIMVLCFLTIIGSDGFKTLVKFLKKIDRKKANDFIINLFNKIFKPYKNILYVSAFVIELCIIIVVLKVSIIKSLTILNAVLIWFVANLAFCIVLVLFGFIAYNILEYLFNFIDTYTDRISDLAFISMFFSTILLGSIIFYPMKMELIIFILFFSTAICLHIVALYGMILIIKSDNPYKENKKNMTRILIGMFVWLIIILLPIYDEVILCTKYVDHAFIFSGGKSNVTGLGDMFYFTIFTFASAGYGDILPNHPLSKSVTIGTILSSIVYLVIFIGSSISSKQD